MKILFSSYSPLNKSGYSTQLNKIVNCLFSYDPTIEFGFICWDMSMFIEYSMQPLTFQDILNISSKFNLTINEFNDNINAKFYLAGKRINYWNKIEIINEHFKCDKLIVFQDIYVFERYKIYNIPCEKYLYIPIHNNFLKHNLLGWDKSYSEEVNNLYHLAFFDKIATPSMFGVKVLESYNYDSMLINHIVEETKLKYTKQQLLQESNLENYFICLMVAKNDNKGDRKAWIQQFTGFQLFLKQLGEKGRNRCRIIIHDSSGIGLKGTIDLELIAKSLNILNYILLPDCSSNEDIVKLYKLADVLLCASKSEGFGLPMVEAQVNGTPVITTNCTSMATNTFYGICTEPQKVSFCVGGINSWSDPSPTNISNAIEYIYNCKYKKNNNKYNFKLKPIDKNNYSQSTILNKWVDFLNLDKKSEKQIDSAQRRLLGEEIFNNHLKEITKLLSNKNIRNIKKSIECKYNAVLIENRQDNRIEPVLLNLLYFTNEEIGVQIFYNEENEDFIKNIINKYNLQNISLIKMSYSKFDINIYQDFVFSKEFYDNIHGEKILIFQTDSLIFKEFDMNYFNYDFVGAVWNEPTMRQPTLAKFFKDKLPIGNGGFNIRDVKKCKMIAGELFNYKRPPMNINEDNVYSYILQEKYTSLNLPSIEDAMYFSVETIKHNDPMAMHAFYKYCDKEYINYILTKHIETIKIERK